jgi:hypothetical protein
MGNLFIEGRWIEIADVGRFLVNNHIFEQLGAGLDHASFALQIIKTKSVA